MSLNRQEIARSSRARNQNRKPMRPLRDAMDDIATPAYRKEPAE